MRSSDDMGRQVVASMNRNGAVLNADDERRIFDSIRCSLVFMEVGQPARELEAERQRRKQAIWELLVPLMTESVHSWAEVEAALSGEDRDRLRDICGDQSLSEVLEIAGGE